MYDLKELIKITRNTSTNNIMDNNHKKNLKIIIHFLVKQFQAIHLSTFQNTFQT